MILKRTWTVPVGSKKGETKKIHPGKHEIERIANPRGEKEPWLVLKNTTIGHEESYWHQWKGDHLGHWEVNIKE